MKDEGLMKEITYLRMKESESKFIRFRFSFKIVQNNFTQFDSSQCQKLYCNEKPGIWVSKFDITLIIIDIRVKSKKQNRSWVFKSV